MCDPSATCNTIMYDYGLSYRPPIILKGENYDMRQKIEKVVFRFTSKVGEKILDSRLCF